MKAIDQYLKLHKISAAHLARQACVSPASMSRWLTGSRRPKYEHLVRLSKVMGLPVDRLLKEFGK